MIERFFPEPQESDSIGRKREREREKERKMEGRGERQRRPRVCEAVRAGEEAGLTSWLDGWVMVGWVVCRLKSDLQGFIGVLATNSC